MSYLVGLQSLRVPTFYPLNTKTVITSDHIPSMVGHCFTFDFAYVSLDSIYIINQHLYGMTMEIVSVGATKVAGFEYNRSCSKIQLANHQRRDLGASSASFVCYEVPNSWFALSSRSEQKAATCIVDAAFCCQFRGAHPLSTLRRFDDMKLVYTASCIMKASDKKEAAPRVPRIISFKSPT